jgi:hypothetical protein
VVAVRDRLVAAARPVDVGGLMGSAGAPVIACCGVPTVDGQHVIVDVIPVRMVEVSVVDEVDVPVVDHCDMAAARSMNVIVILVGVMLVAHHPERYAIGRASEAGGMTHADAAVARPQALPARAGLLLP